MEVALAMVLISLVIFGGLSTFVLNLNRWGDVDLVDIPNLLRCRFGRFRGLLKVLNAERDTHEFIKRFAKAETSQTVDLAAYTLKSARGFGNDIRGFYSDARHSIVLSKFGWGYIALIGFDVVGDVIFVKQIQGRYGFKEHLAPLKWERMLLAVVVQSARQSGLKEVRVQPAHKNKWPTVSDQAANGRGKMLYDVTARRSGFKFDEDADCFKLVLT